MRGRACPVAVALVLWAASVRGEIPLGPEFLVNTYTTSSQKTPAVAVAADGSFVVVWESFGQDGSQYGIFGRLYDASGTPMGATDFRVNTYTAGYQTSARVATSADQFVVVWTGKDQDGSYDGVFGRMFNSVTGAASDEFRVNTTTQSNQRHPAVASDAAGNFVVVWASFTQDHYFGGGIYAQRYSASGLPQGREFLVNTFTTNSQTRPSVAMDPDGNFVVVWQSSGQDGASYGIFGQRYDSEGIRAGEEFRVNFTTAGRQTFPSVATDADGGFVVAWDEYNYGMPNRVFARRYDAAGAPEGRDIRVGTYTTTSHWAPAVAMDPGGDFVVVWVSEHGSDRDVSGQKFTADGMRKGVEFRVNSFTTGVQLDPAVGADAAGRFVTVRTESGGGGADVIGRRFSPDPDAMFADDFETGNLAAWSGSATDAGDLSTSIFAAMKSSGLGLQGVIDDTAGLYVQDDTPEDEDRYRARFYLDPNGFDPGEGLAHRRIRVFLAFSEAPIRRVAAIVLRRLGGAYSLMVRARLDDDTQADTTFVPITDGPHVVEIDLRCSSGPDALDGGLDLWVDGVLTRQLSALDNHLGEADFVRLGALSVKAGAGGTLYWDEFVSRRASYIGP